MGGWNDIRDARLSAMWAAGKTTREIAAELGLKNPGNVSLRAKHLGLPGREVGARKRAGLREQFLDLLGLGLTRREIAKRLGVWPSKVTYLCQELGVRPGGTRPPATITNIKAGGSRN